MTGSWPATTAKCTGTTIGDFSTNRANSYMHLYAAVYSYTLSQATLASFLYRCLFCTPTGNQSSLLYRLHAKKAINPCFHHSAATYGLSNLPCRRYILRFYSQTNNVENGMNEVDNCNW